MSQPELILDVDDVLLEWTSGFLGGNKRGEPDGVFQDVFSDEDIIAFNKSAAFGKLLPVENAVKLVEVAVSRGYMIICLSSCGDSHETVNLRNSNLKNVFGDVFYKIICLPLYSSKYDELNKFKNTVFVDDTLKNCKEALVSGNRPFYYRRAWKPETSEYTAISDLMDIVHILDNNIYAPRTQHPFVHTLLHYIITAMYDTLTALNLWYSL